MSKVSGPEASPSVFTVPDPAEFRRQAEAVREADAADPDLLASLDVALDDLLIAIAEGGDRPSDR